MTPWLIVLAGPNGSGKSTLARTEAFKASLMRNGAKMLNPDEMAKLAPAGTNALIWSGREMRRQIDESISTKRSFSFETTLSGNNHQHIIRECQQAGYRVAVHYVFVSAVELAIKRVINRVLLGGHDVPEADQRRRYRRSLENAKELFQTCDEAFVYLNDTLEPHQLVAVYENGKPTFKNIITDWLP
jgi:predicted ABC-type ATPase